MKIILVIFALAFSLSASAVMPVTPRSGCDALAPEKMGICKANEEEWIKDAIKKSNYCKQDSDCMVTNFGCPFGCNSLINKSENLRVLEWILSYNKSHNECEYKCSAPAESVTCEEGVCVAK